MSYVLKEGFSGFKRAKLSTSISIFTVAISLILLGTFAIVFLNLHRFAESLRSEVQIKVFIDNAFPSAQHARLKTQLEQLPGINAAEYVSKDDAARIFQDDFGEDINSILDFNPLPASFNLSLESEYIHPDSIARLVTAIEAAEGTESVAYGKTLIELLTRRMQTFIAVSIGIGLLLGISAIFLVSNTIRLTIYAKRKLIQTMKLVGATRGFIRKPFLLEGLTQGFLGGILAGLCIYGAVFILQKNLPDSMASVIRPDIHYYGIVLLAGSVLGLLGSAVSIRRFLK
jgi:cell division transport system permease protein